jgi:hypothetical protein
MFAFEIARPPTKEMKRAYRMIQDCQKYIWSSSDPTPLFLECALKAIRSIRPTLMMTEGNTTSSSDVFIIAAEYHDIIEKSLLWLQANLDFDPDSLQRRHATLVAEMVEEEKIFTREQYHYLHIWVSTQCDKDPPNLMSKNLRHGRLGDVIDEVLGVKGMKPAPRGLPAGCYQWGFKKEEPGQDYWRSCNCA